MCDDSDSDWTTDGDGSPLRSIRNVSTLLEISAVSFPAYGSTSIEARNQTYVKPPVKAMSNKELSGVLSNAALTEVMQRIDNADVVVRRRRLLDQILS
jgi:phage head maturation protease